ncbi:MAG: hypothetical protein IPN51_08540 [Chloracidobacterium sp.]|nr:hypothetical protein [Chloracidobacterium sp.]
MKKLSLIIACLVLTVLVVSVARSQSGGSFTITKSVIGGGGGANCGRGFHARRHDGRGGRRDDIDWRVI